MRTTDALTAENSRTAGSAIYPSLGLVSSVHNESSVGSWSSHVRRHRIGYLPYNSALEPISE